ncbi:tetratricopeptide repeat protein [Arsukibacterium indicum]|uniref:Sel1 repeat family protein n=1 Tax=Arsukibacterium indicum TaxID=2848612 RepID=A0ABS6MIJ1_9GAMM|nr:tetratricopeptide repeat protein [Arsukibacterium indicum]MBV2128628.1 sel1 repeat family protein [Arsukibacterium indicum]
MRKTRIGLVLALSSALFFAPIAAIATAQPAGFCASVSCQSEFKQLERMANNGSGEAATIVAVAYARGEGVEQDIKKARRHIKKAVSWDEPMALHQMASWLRQGFIFEQDIARADELLERAARAEFAPALTDKAKLLLAQDIPQADKEAVALLELANEQFYKPAQYLLAQLLVSGVGIESDLARAGVIYKNLALESYADSRQRLDEIINALEQISAQPEPELVALVQPVLTNLKQIDDIEVIEVRGEQFDANSELSNIVSQLNSLNIYYRGNTGSRIPGNLCGRGASMCSVAFDRKTDADFGATTVGELMGQ